MVVVAQCLGLRVREILALQWPDINFADLTMRVTRGVVDEVKRNILKMTFRSIPISLRSC